MNSKDPVIFFGVAVGLVGFALLLSAVLCSLVRRFAAHLGFLDRPGGHKGHRVPVALGGGVAIWLTTVSVIGLGLLLLSFAGATLPAPLAVHAGGALSRTGELVRILVMSSLIMLMGLADDRRPLDWRFRLGFQLLCATALAATGIRVTLFGPFTHPVLGGIVTVLWIVGLTNAFNMLDNMDGLAASVGLIEAVRFSLAQIAVGTLFAPAVLLIVVGALLGFLVHNFPPARLYMGDAGSNFLGFLLGSMTVVGTFTRDPYPPYSVLAPLLVMAVPLYDMTSVVLIRLREGRSPFQADRRHFSHRLVARGLTPLQAVLTIDLVTLASGLGALLLHTLNAVGAAVVLAQTCCLLGVVAVLEFSAQRSDSGNDQTRSQTTGPS